MKRKEELSRADFLTLVMRSLLYLSGAALAFALLRYFGFRGPETESKIHILGNVADFPPGTRRIFTEEKIFLIRSEQGWRALSIICPHLGCVVRRQTEGGFECPCHGSAFDDEGNRLKGPAGRGLDPLKVEIDGQGQIIVSA